MTSSRRPTTFLAVAAIFVPIALLWLMALLAWRTEELRLRSSTMTEVAIRLAEPDRLAEQSAATLGQAVRRQVGFMNDAISRALGRAGELEAMVHNEVSVLERSYEENERKIRGLISELSGERHALVNTSDRVSESLIRLGSEIPTLIEKLSDQQVKLAKVIEGAGENLTTLETSLATSVGRLETAVGGRTEQLQNVLENYTSALGTALGSRAEQMQITFDNQLQQLDASLGNRTENLQTVFEEYARAIDATLANRAQALDYQLVERTRSLDEAFGERLRLFDESIMRSTSAIDTAVVDKTEALTNALDAHAVSFRETIGKQATDLDEALMQGINSVRRASENITRQSIKAMEGLAGQSDLLKNISENLLAQISGVTGRFENQGQQIMRAANSLETANYKIDKTLQTRHAELTQTLDRLSGKADEFTNFVGDYSSTIEGSLTEADLRARTRARAHARANQRRKRAHAGRSAPPLDLGINDHDQRARLAQQPFRRNIRGDAPASDARCRRYRRRAGAPAQRDGAPAGRGARKLRRHAPRPARPDQGAGSALAARRAQRRAARRYPAAATARRGAVSQRVRPPARPEPGALPHLAVVDHRAGARQPAAPARRACRQPRRLVARRPAGARLTRRGDRPRPCWQGAPRQAQGAAFNLDLEAIARALDPATAAAIWPRLRSGQRGVMVRSIYGNEGRAMFDDVSHRCRNDGELSRTVSRYLADFERIVAETDQRDPTGRLSQGQLVSDTGRVYLFLAHASGRLG